MTQTRLTLHLLATVALLVSASCAAPEPWETDDPKEAVEGFITAVYFGRGDLAWHFLAPEVQKTIEARAAAINADAGQPVVKGPELIAGVGFVGPHHVASYEVVPTDDPDRVAVTVKTQLDDQRTIDMVRLREGWRVTNLQIPPADRARLPQAARRAQDTPTDSGDAGTPPVEPPETPSTETP